MKYIKIILTRAKGFVKKILKGVIKLLEHPDVTSAIRTGLPRHKYKRTIYCPNCGAELTEESTLYSMNIKGFKTILGCNECIETESAEEALDE